MSKGEIQEVEKYILIEILPLQSIEDLPSPETLNWADGVVLVYSITERGSFNFVKQVWNIFQVSREKTATELFVLINSLRPGH